MRLSLGRSARGYPSPHATSKARTINASKAAMVRTTGRFIATFLVLNATGQLHNFRQIRKLPHVRCREPRQLLPPRGKKMNFNLPSIDQAWLPLHQSCLFAPRDERHHAVRLRLQTLRKFADGRPSALGKSLGMKHQLVLQHRDALLARRVFAEPQKTAQSEAEFRECFEALFLQGGLIVRHEIYRKWPPNVSAGQSATQGYYSQHDIINLIS